MPEENELRKLVAEWKPKPGALMEYDGDNHGDTAEAASNQAYSACATRLESALDRMEGQGKTRVRKSEETMDNYARSEDATLVSERKFEKWFDNWDQTGNLEIKRLCSIAYRVGVDDRKDAALAAAKTPASGKCGEPAGTFIAGQSWFVCALPKGHEPSTHPYAIGGHLRGGNCCVHGEYLGTECPHWPRCIEEQYPTSRSAAKTPASVEEAIRKALPCECLEGKQHMETRFGHAHDCPAFYREAIAQLVSASREEALDRAVNLLDQGHGDMCLCDICNRACAIRALKGASR